IYEILKRIHRIIQATPQATFLSPNQIIENYQNTDITTSSDKEGRLTEALSSFYNNDFCFLDHESKESLEVEETEVLSSVDKKLSFFTVIENYSSNSHHFKSEDSRLDTNIRRSSVNTIEQQETIIRTIECFQKILADKSMNFQDPQGGQLSRIKEVI